MAPFRTVLFFFLFISPDINGQDVGTMGHDLYEFLKKLIEALTSTDWGKKLDDLLSRAADHNISEECISDLRYIKNIIMDKDGLHGKTRLNESRTVLQMLDASAKIPAGVMRGKIIWTGLPNECFGISKLVRNRQRDFRGAYCRANIKVPGYGCAETVHQELFNSPMIAYDVCVPDSCRHDVEKILNQSIKFTQVCSVKCMEDESRFTTGSYVTLTLLALIFTISVLGTIVDYYVVKENAEKSFKMNYWLECSVCFSFYSNVPSIFDVSKKPGQIHMLNGVRFFTICWVIAGHMIVLMLLTADNPFDIMAMVSRLSSQWLINAYFAVDTFFFISGFLTAFLFFKTVKNNPRQAFSPAGWVMYYLHRILRLSPAYYMVIAFHTWITPELMRRSITAFNYYPMDSCPTTWWANFLYMTNYYHLDNQCYVSSWYLSTDFQIFAVAPIVLICFAWNRKAGYAFSLFLLAASAAAHIALVIHYHFPPSDIIQTVVPHDPQMTVPFEQYTLLIYDAPWIRYPPYLIGIVLGHFMQTTSRIKMSKLVSTGLFVLAFGTMIGCLHFLYHYFQGNLLPVEVRAVYSALSKPLWAISLGWIVYSCFHGYGGFVNDFLSMGIFIPLGRLSYSVYLLHMSVLFITGSFRGSRIVYTGIAQFLITDLIPVCILTFILAIFLSSILEIGTGKLEAKLLGVDRRRLRDKDSQ